MTTPCPHCGSRPFVDVLRPRAFCPSEQYQVLCPRCHCFGPVSDSEEGALSAWDSMAGRMRA